MQICGVFFALEIHVLHKAINVIDIYNERLTELCCFFSPQVALEVML